VRLDTDGHAGLLALDAAAALDKKPSRQCN
jgi:hypothetical protein